MFLVPGDKCLMSAFSGTTSSSNTMVPGNDAHHDSKMKDSNMDDRYKIENCNALLLLDGISIGKTQMSMSVQSYFMMKTRKSTCTSMQEFKQKLTNFYNGGQRYSTK